MSAVASRAKLRDMLGADIQAEQHTSVPRQFVKDFEKVAAHYKLKELGEYDEAKAAARNNIDAAIVCYSQMAKEIA